MSQLFVGIPIGKNKTMYFDVILVLGAPIIFAILGFTSNHYLLILSLILSIFIVITPIRMSVMNPVALIIILDENEGEIS